MKESNNVFNSRLYSQAIYRVFEIFSITQKQLSKMEAANALVLNDLLKMNNSRIKEYKRASRQVSDFYWSTVFMNSADESEQFVRELAAAIERLGENPDLHSSNNTQKLLSFSSGAYNFLFGNSDQTILNKCKCMEEAMQKIYSDAIENSECNDESKVLIANHLNVLHYSYNRISGYHDKRLSSV